MECPASVEFAKANASIPNGACVEVGFHKARQSVGTGACVEVAIGDAALGCGQVHVRNSRFPDRVVLVPRDRWEQLVADAQTLGTVVLAEWFPEEVYGDFAATFFDFEVQAFKSGVLGNEPRITGGSAA